MKKLNKNEANSFLKEIDMLIGNWNEIKSINIESDLEEDSIIYQASRNADELYCFSYHLASWIPNDDWKIFQIDNSTSLLFHEEFLLRKLLYNKEFTFDFIKDKTFLFNFDKDKLENEILLANLIYLFLLFESHCYIVSSSSKNGEILSIQDGFVYFIYKNKKVKKTTLEKLKEFEKNPTEFPTWMKF